MKKLALICLLLSGCSSAPRVEPKGTEYVCTAFNAHGVYAKYLITATSLDLANKIAQEVNDRFVAKGVLPESAVDCRLPQ